MADIGDMGELKFHYWCSEVGIVCNGSKIDKTGWDFFIEFNNLLDTSIPLDMHPSRIEAKVQVKATEGCKQSVQVSLANLQRISTAIQPAFFVFIEFDNKHQFVRAYIKHVDEYLIRKILLRLRKASASNQASKIHKLEMVVNYDPKNDTEIKNGYELEKAILNFIPDGLESYQKYKSNLLSKIGFENGYGHINFTLDEKDIESFIDMSLGLNRSIVLSNAKFFNSRFGIDIEDRRIPIEKNQPITLQITDVKPAALGKIRFMVEGISSSSIDFSCELYVPQVFINNENYLKFRIKSDLFEIFVFKDKFIFTVLSQDKAFDFKLIYKTVKLLYWISNYTDNIKAKIIFNDFHPITISGLGMTDKVDSYLELWNIAESTKYLMDVFDLFDVTVSMNNLKFFGPSLIGLKKVLMNEFSEIRFSLDDYYNKTLENFVFVYSFFAILGNQTLCVFLGLEGKAILVSDNSKYTLQPSAVNVHNKITFTESEMPDSEQLESIFSSIEESYINMGKIVVRMSNFKIFTPSTP